MKRTYTDFVKFVKNTLEPEPLSLNFRPKSYKFFGGEEKPFYDIFGLFGLGAGFGPSAPPGDDKKSDDNDDDDTENGDPKPPSYEELMKNPDSYPAIKDPPSYEELMKNPDSYPVFDGASAPPSYEESMKNPVIDGASAPPPYEEVEKENRESLGLISDKLLSPVPNKIEEEADRRNAAKKAKSAEEQENVALLASQAAERIRQGVAEAAKFIAAQKEEQRFREYSDRFFGRSPVVEIKEEEKPLGAFGSQFAFGSQPVPTFGNQPDPTFGLINKPSKKDPAGTVVFTKKSEKVFEENPEAFVETLERTLKTTNEKIAQTREKIENHFESVSSKTIYRGENSDAIRKLQEEEKRLLKTYGNVWTLLTTAKNKLREQKKELPKEQSLEKKTKEAAAPLINVVTVKKEEPLSPNIDVKESLKAVAANTPESTPTLEMLARSPVEVTSTPLRAFDVNEMIITPPQSSKIQVRPAEVEMPEDEQIARVGMAKLNKLIEVESQGKPDENENIIKQLKEDLQTWLNNPDHKGDPRRGGWDAIGSVKRAIKEHFKPKQTIDQKTVQQGNKFLSRFKNSPIGKKLFTS